MSGAEAQLTSPFKCAAAKHFGQHRKCTATAESQRRCKVCSHTVCDLCEAPHCCSHGRLRPDGSGYCDHVNACAACHGHGEHSAYCSYRRADVSDTKAEAKRVVKRWAAIAAVAEAITLLQRLSAALPDTDINEDVLSNITTAISLHSLRGALIAIVGTDTSLVDVPAVEVIT